MRRFLFLLIPVVVGANASPQSCIKKGYAFSRPISRGTQPIDVEENYLVNFELFAYLETGKSKDLKIQKAWTCINSYAVSSTFSNSKIIDFSKEHPTKEFKIKIDQGSKLLLLQFEQNEVKGKVPDHIKNVKTGTLLLEVVCKNKKTYYTITKINRLKTDLSVN